MNWNYGVAVGLAVAGFFLIFRIANELTAFRNEIAAWRAEVRGALYTTNVTSIEDTYALRVSEKLDKIAADMSDAGMLARRELATNEPRNGTAVDTIRSVEKTLGGAIMDIRHDLGEMREQSWSQTPQHQEALSDVD